jgi:tetrapyrrole methylase family protein / MazG family protein
VALVHAVGTADEQVEWLPLFEIDRSARIAHLTTLYVPPLPRPSGLETLQETVAHLRAPNGCPWDREQTHQTLRTTLLEETHEVLEAIDADDPAAMREEFGDLLLQVVLQSQIAIEDGEFSLAEVIAGLNEKLIRRHPHVFGDVKVSGVGQVLENWEKIKAVERQNDEKPDYGALGQVPPSLPALAQSVILQRRAARVGFDWPDVSGVIDKLQEEVGELKAAQDPAERENELGDLLFAVVNWARWLDIDPESALRQANAKFRKRFARIEAAAKAQGRAVNDLTLDEMEAEWQAAKAG